MPVFVIGEEGRLRVADEVRLIPEREAREAFSNRKIKIGPVFHLNYQGRGLPYSAHIKRGVAQEGPGFYVRVLPPDAEEGLAALDSAIEEARAALNRLNAERQEYLANHVKRGERITMRHVTHNEGS